MLSYREWPQSRSVHSVSTTHTDRSHSLRDNEAPHDLAIALPIGRPTAELVIALLDDLFVVLDIVAQHVSTVGRDDTDVDI